MPDGASAATPPSGSGAASGSPPAKISDRPERSPIAVIRVLDKVTAETLRFAAPVGRPVRYKALVFQVKACETWGVGTADPRPSAYLLVTADSPGQAPREVFRGWMFAKAPGVHAFVHPIYDAWLEDCIAQAPGV